MTIATINKKKQKRGFDALLNQFGSLGSVAMNAAPVFANAAVKAVRQTPVKTNYAERLNLMIAVGANFDVSADDFQVFGTENLTDAEKSFLAANKAAILCTLHQSALMKYLPLDYIPRFKNEINERAAILFDGAETEPPFEVIAEVAREWFVDVLEEMLKQ